ncbi:MAG: DUF3370 domain-containing protein [Cyanobacteria bacterium P01_D01_bin.105]
MSSLLSLFALASSFSGLALITAIASGQQSVMASAQVLDQAPSQASEQTIAQAENGIITIEQEVRPLPGGLDDVPVFNSNSPEIIESDGILLSTFPRRGKSDPSAHLNYAFNGRFDIFSHHVARGTSDRDTRTVYESIIVHNPGDRPITLTIRDGATHISQESPWNAIASGSNNLYSNNFSGPGSRVMNDVLRDRRQAIFPGSVTIPPRQSHLLLNAPIPLRRLNVPTDGSLVPGRELTPAPTNASSGEGPRLNGRSTLMRLNSSGPVYVASLAMHAPQANGQEFVPSLAEWKVLLAKGQLSTPRDLPPSRPGSREEPFRYGRVAGVAKGSQWRGTLTDSRSSQLSIPSPGESISYTLSTLERNTFGTGQIQSAPLTARYGDTAYLSNGNYGIEYNLNMPLTNDTDSQKTVSLSIQTPLQNDRLNNALQFKANPDRRVFFRGTVLFIYKADDGRSRAAYTYVEQNQGEQGQPLVNLTLAPGEQRNVNVQFLYPPDATPPQVLTITTSS